MFSLRYAGVILALKMGYYLSQISIQDLEELGFELGDDKEDRENIAKVQRKYYLNLLTRRQKSVAKLLDDGYSRKEIADNLGVCVQAVHQIVIRIRRRLKTRADIPSYPYPPLQDFSRELILILVSTYPGLTSQAIYRWWYYHPALKDYKRPTVKTITKIMESLYG